MTCSLHIWHVDPATKVRKYVGPAKTDYDWLLFKREQGAKRDEFICNNVSPTGTVGTTVRPPAKATARSQPSSKAAEAMFRARREADRKMAESQKARAEKKAQSDKRRAEDDREMEAIRQDAAGLVEQHKDDERRDLEAGINN